MSLYNSAPSNWHLGSSAYSSELTPSESTENSLSGQQFQQFQDIDKFVKELNQSQDETDQSIVINLYLF